jgi:glycosyltransferase involved in cell wall biosynthesis
MDVSIIVPLFKGKKYIESIIESIQRNIKEYSKYFNYECELIFVNDDPSEHLKVDLENCIGLNVKIFNMEKNLGIHGARVFGYKQSRGRFILFLDQDDKISDEYIVQQRMQIQDYDAIVCNVYREKVWMITKRKHCSDDKLYKTTQLKSFLDGNSIISPGQVLIRKDKIPVLWLNEILTINGADDYLLWVLMLSQGARFTINTDCLFTHMEYGSNTSSNSRGMYESTMQCMNILKNNDILNNEQLDEVGKWIDKIKPISKKTQGIIALYDQWVSILQKGKRLSSYFEIHNCKKIAIYGMGDLGNRLYEELIGSSVTVSFAIDKKAELIECGVPVITVDDDNILSLLSQVDLVVVTAISAYEEICGKLWEICETPIKSLEEVIVEMLL